MQTDINSPITLTQYFLTTTVAAKACHQKHSAVSTKSQQLALTLPCLYHIQNSNQMQHLQYSSLTPNPIFFNAPRAHKNLREESFLLTCLLHFGGSRYRHRSLRHLHGLVKHHLQDPIDTLICFVVSPAYT